MTSLDKISIWGSQESIFKLHNSFVWLLTFLALRVEGIEDVCEGFIKRAPEIMFVD